MKMNPLSLYNLTFKTNLNLIFIINKINIEMRSELLKVKSDDNPTVFLSSSNSLMKGSSHF